MKYSEIKNMSLDELTSKVRIESDELSRLKFAHAVSPIENPIRIRNKRRLIAKLKTNIAERKNENK